jgi:hypothetical protein
LNFTAFSSGIIILPQLIHLAIFLPLLRQ